MQCAMMATDRRTASEHVFGEPRDIPAVAVERLSHVYLLAFWL